MDNYLNLKSGIAHLLNLRYNNFMKLFIFYASWAIFPFLAAAAYFLFNSKKRKRKILTGIFIAAGVVFVYARFAEPQILSVNNQEIKASLPEIKIAVFSDLHYGVYQNVVMIDKIVEKINKENPDIVLIPGDFAYHLNKEEIPNVLEGIKNLSAPSFSVIGNHDIGFSRDGKDEEDISAELADFLESAGIKVLENKTEEIEVRGEKIKIIGLDDFWSGSADYNLLEDVCSDDNVIVLAHNPDAVYQFPDEFKVNADLVVSGHTHGGQMRIPFLYKFAIPSEYDFDSGLYDIEGVKVFVTSGIGMTGLPCRFLIAPRVDIIEVESS